jgi:hypothetical protein
MRDPDLIARFVGTFGKFDDMWCCKELDPAGSELRATEPDESGWFEWRPVKMETEHAALEAIYSKLPARFPPLYERLILSYRWAQIDVGTFRLLPNPPGEDLGGLLAEIERDATLHKNLLPAGYIQFGRGPDVDYDPVCFDTHSRTSNRDYRIVKIDHEQILCYDRVKVVAQLAPSFRHLIEQTIERAEPARQ